jgi:hypothetical protein
LYRYRVFHTDPNGARVYSNTVEAMLGSTIEHTLVLYPNPASSTVRVQLEGADLARIEVFDATGRLVQQLQPIGPEATLNVAQWARGVYNVQVYDAAGGVYTQKLVLNP